MELQRALEASELEEAMAQSRLAAQDQQLYRVADTVPSDLNPAAADDQELQLAMELSEAEAKQAAKGKRVLQHTPSEEDLQRALQESANLASSRPQHQQPPYASSAHHSSGEGSSAMQPDQDATDAELARALYESEQLAAASAPSRHAQTAEPPSPASAPMLASQLEAKHTHQSARATSSSSSPPMPSHSRAAPNQPAHMQPAMDSNVRYPDIYQSGSSSSYTPSHHQSQQRQSPRQEPLRQQAAQQPSPSQAPRIPQQGQSQPSTQLQAAPKHQQQPAVGHRLLPLQPQPRHGFDQPGGSPPGAGPYLDGYHGSANLESMLTGDQAFAQALQDEEYKAVMKAAGIQAPPKAHSSARQQPGQVQDCGTCPGCGLRLSSPVIVVGGGQSWHCDCFRCTACQRPIPPGQRYGIGAEDHMPYHIQCHSQKFDPRCSVCHDLIPHKVVTCAPHLHAVMTKQNTHVSRMCRNASMHVCM